MNPNEETPTARCNHCSDLRVQACLCGGGDDGFGVQCPHCQGLGWLDCEECNTKHGSLLNLQKLQSFFPRIAEATLDEKIALNSQEILEVFLPQFLNVQGPLDQIAQANHLQSLDLQQLLRVYFFKTQQTMYSWLEQNDGRPKPVRFAAWAQKISVHCNEALPQHYDLKQALLQFSHFWKLHSNLEFPYKSLGFQWQKLQCLLLLEYNRALVAKGSNEFHFSRGALPLNQEENQILVRLLDELCTAPQGL